MAERAVVWTETAARQRREILKYWTKRSGGLFFSAGGLFLYLLDNQPLGFLGVADNKCWQ